MADAFRFLTNLWEMPSPCTVWPYKEYDPTIGRNTVQPFVQHKLLPEDYENFVDDQLRYRIYEDRRGNFAPEEQRPYLYIVVPENET